MDYTLRFRITEDGKLNVRSLSSYEVMDVCVWSVDEGKDTIKLRLKAGSYRPINETPFKWRSLAGG